MDLYTSEFRCKVPKKSMKIFNNTFIKKFNDLKHFKWNAIEIDNYY